MPTANDLPEVLETTEPERLATGFIFTEGPLWHPDGNCGAIPPSRRSLILAVNSPKPKSARSFTPKSSERDPVVFSIGRCSITAMAISAAAAGFGPGSMHSARRISKWGSIS